MSQKKLPGLLLLIFTGIVSASYFLYLNAQAQAQGGYYPPGGAGGGGVTNVATTSPLTGGPITTTGSVACASCVTSASALASTALMTGASGQGTQTPSSSTFLDASGNLTVNGNYSTNLGNITTTNGNLNATGGSVVAGGNINMGGVGNFFAFNRSLLSSPADGQWLMRNQAGTGFTSLQFGGTSASFPEWKRNATAFNARLADDSADAPITTAAITASGNIQAPTYGTQNNCSNAASPAVCGSAAAGSVAIPTGTNPTLVVNTSIVTAASQIILTPDDSVTIASTTCNSTLATLVGGMAVTARTAGISFTISFNGTISTNKLCLNYHIIN